MAIASPDPAGVAVRLDEMVRERNREIAIDAVAEAGTGIMFAILVFGSVLVAGFFIGLSCLNPTPIRADIFAILFTLLYAGVATYEAWRRVDPLSELDPESDALLLPIVVGKTIILFQPRLATAGIAALLIGGPLNLFTAIGTWRHRLQSSPELIEQAAHLLIACRRGVPVSKLESVRAALLVRRLTLVLVAPREGGETLILTQKGETLVGK